MRYHSNCIEVYRRTAAIYDKTDKENYRLIIILPNICKVYQSFIYDQMYPLFDQMFLKLQCSFRKGFNAEQSLIHMTEKLRKYLDTGDHGIVLLTDLSKIFDCIYHHLLVGKLNACVANKNSLYFFASYLQRRKQITKVNFPSSNFDYIFSGVPQDPILDPLFFNIYICSLFLGIGDSDIASYADNKTSCTFSSELEVSMKNSEIIQ